jgi:A/G-specific adenine glycosylase
MEPLQRAVLDWYALHGRRLFLRTLRDPYAIWIAETMSQQTQIARVDAALPAFLAAFPTLHELAAAETGEVLRAWAGLGYHRRALGLRSAARRICAEHGGEMPREPAVLEALPGVGPYTARALAATAFGEPETALDVNSTRVLARLLGRGPARPGLRRALQPLVDAMAPPGHSADWNHALMDLGAMICRPVPDCRRCPLAKWCLTRPSISAQPPAVTDPRTNVTRANPVPFRDTRRWARGRVLQHLRDQPAASWTTLDTASLAMPQERLDDAVRTLQHDGLLELDAAGRARLPRD